MRSSSSPDARPARFLFEQERPRDLPGSNQTGFGALGAVAQKPADRHAREARDAERLPRGGGQLRRTQRSDQARRALAEHQRRVDAAAAVTPRLGALAPLARRYHPIDENRTAFAVHLGALLVVSLRKGVGRRRAPETHDIP